MLETTLGQLLINESLPEELRDYNRVLDKDSTSELFQKLAEQHPHKYREVSKRLSDIGYQAAYTTGGNSVGLSALRPSIAIRQLRAKLLAEIDAINDDPRLSAEQRSAKIVEITQNAQEKLKKDVLHESLAERNPLALQLIGAGRGNVGTLNSLRGADLLYVDHHDQPIPMPVLKNYSEGLDPAEYFAGAFGARKGLYDVKIGTAKAGFLSKQLAQAAHRLITTAIDDDTEDPDEDPALRTPRGLPVDTDDADSVGSLLSHPIGGYARNTVLTSQILKDLASRGINQILVRSPTVGGPADGGVYARDVGIREKGRIAPVGDYVGTAAAQALGERIAQSALSSKHAGGVAGSTAAAVSGFGAVNNLVQSPETVHGGATHAQLDGTVSAIHPAPQGGFTVTIANQLHYVQPGLNILVKPGDEIEAGDVVSDGLPSPAEIVKHKGIGEGRRYFTRVFRQTLKNSGITSNRRNIELLARGLINHVKLNDEVGDWAPDDVVPYSAIERSWQPRPGSVAATPNQHVGRYLERPVLHYSVGTRITKSMAKLLGDYGVKQVEAHPNPPPFDPIYIRGMAQASQDPDWMTQQGGSYQSKSLLEATRRGAVSDTAGSSFIPSLAEGKDFGIAGLTKGWAPEPTLPKTP